MPNPSRRSTPLPKGWARIRQRILKRDGARCRVCGAPATVVDHIVPVVEGGTDDDSNLQSLCRRHSDRKTAREANRHNPRAQSRKRPQEPHPGALG